MTSIHLKNGQSSKWDYKQGDIALDGSEITHIIGREADFIIYNCDDGSIGWEHREIPEWSYIAIEQFEKLSAKIPTFLGQIHKEDIKAQMAVSLLSAFRSQEHDKNSVLACFNEAWNCVDEFEERIILLAGDGFYIKIGTS